MALLGIDLGGTKLALAIFSDEGSLLSVKVKALDNRKGNEAGKLISDEVNIITGEMRSSGEEILSVGISVPGIYHASTGRVWAPNIEGWEDYPLLEGMQKVCGSIPVTIDSDRACYILGEVWQGNAKGCRNAIYLAIGTGIGAGILVDGAILRGNHDIAGCIGWMSLQKPFIDQYAGCGCFEYHASGEGITRAARLLMMKQPDYSGELSLINIEALKTSDVFSAYDNGDAIAKSVIDSCVEFWGMAIANLVSLFNPEKIILGGGVFGPGAGLIPGIRNEAAKWAQPVGMKDVTIGASGLGGDAGVYGAAWLALKKLSEPN